MTSTENGVNTSPKRASSPLIDTLSGSIAGMIGLVVGSPFDFVKVRMQNQTAGNTKVHIIPTIFQAWKNEGITAFYKGLLPPLIGEGILNSVWFGTYAVVSALLQKDRNKNLTFAQGCIAGTAAGVTGSFVYGPVDLVKVRVQMSKERGDKRKKPTQIIKEIYKSDGIWGFTRGLGTTIIREVPSMSAYFGIYNSLKQAVTRSDGTISLFGQIIAGGTAGATAWACVYPVDVVKTRMQATSQFNSVRACVTSMIQNEGIFSFFQGLTPCLMRSFPVNATIFLVYELIIKFSFKITG